MPSFDVRKTWARSLALVAAASAVVACSDDPKPSTGTGAEGQACYANNTCNAGLSCSASVCVKGNPADGDAGRADGSSANTSDGTKCAIQDKGCDSACLDNCRANPTCGDPDRVCCQGYTTPGVYCLGKCMTEGTLNCSGQCIDTQMDSKNCGSCGNACSAGYGCAAGKCSNTP